MDVISVRLHILYEYRTCGFHLLVLIMLRADIQTSIVYCVYRYRVLANRNGSILSPDGDPTEEVAEDNEKGYQSCIVESSSGDQSVLLSSLHSSSQLPVIELEVRMWSLMKL